MIERTDSDREPASVDQSWGRIESWLRQNQLHTRLGLRPGASEEQLAWFGRHTRQELPAEVKRTWAIHDGQWIGGLGGSGAPGVFFGVSMLPLLEPELPNALATWREQAKRNQESGSSHKEVGAGWSSLPADAVRAVRWSTAWIPLGVDGQGNLLMVDLEPGPSGRSGQVVALRGDDPVRVVLASRWAHFLEDVADELEAGTGLSAREAGDETMKLTVSEGGPIGWLKQRLRSTPAAPRFRPASLLELRGSWSEAKFRSRKTQIGPASEGTGGAGTTPVITGPVADECCAIVRGYIDAMSAYDRYWLEIRPLRPFGYSELGEQCHDGKCFICGSTSIEDDARGRPEADLVRRMQGANAGYGDGEGLTSIQRERVLRVGKFFEEALRMKREIYEQYWGELPENERIWFHYNDPSKYDPACNQIAEVRLVAQDHVVVLMEPETEAGTPAYLGYHLEEVGGRWLICKEALPFEDVCKRLVRPAPSYDQATRDAANHPAAEAIARARELFAILDEEDSPKAHPDADEDVASWFAKQGTHIELDDRGVCTVLSLADTGINDADMAFVASLTGLQELTLGPKVTDAGMVHLKGLTELTELSFREGMKSPKIRGSGLAHLHKMTELTWLDLGYLPIDDVGLAHLRGPVSLTDFRLYGTRVTDAGLAHLTVLPNLEELDLRETNVKGAGLADLAPLKLLKALNLTATRITDAGLAGLVFLTSLRDLNLSRTRITDAGIATLARLTWLESLSLFETDITPEGIDKLRSSLPDCQID